jgi:hypothetical protein
MIILNSYMKQWLLNQLQIKVLTLNLLYSGSINGWSPYRFHELCDEKGPTIIIMKSKAGRVFGGFAMQSWDSVTDDYKPDDKAFIYSIDRQQIYRVIDPQKALFCGQYYGPCFGCAALGLSLDALNEDGGGRCFTNGYDDGSIYGIKSDARGKHEVTGEGNKREGKKKEFTCVELEVFGVTFCV